MSWRQPVRGAGAWRQAIGQLRQLVEDLSFLAQQLVGPPATVASAAASGAAARDTAAHASFCRLLSSLVALRGLRLHARAAHLVLGALRQWADGIGSAPAAPAAPHSGAGAGAAAGGGSSSSAAPGPGAEDAGGAGGGPQLEALGALVALLPDHLHLLAEHERVAQLAALQSLVALPSRPTASGALLEAQTLALTALATCCDRAAGPGAAPSPGSAAHGPAGGGGGAAGGGGGGAIGPAGALTPDEVAAVLGWASGLLQAACCRAKPVEDAAHAKLYAALVRAVQSAVGASRSAWAGRAAAVVEGLQRLLTYGAQASAAATAAAASGSAGAAEGAGGGGRPDGPERGAPAGGGGGRSYKPPHLRRRESEASAYSDSEAGSDTEHAASSSGSHAGGLPTHGPVVDRFRSSRVRLGVLSCLQAMARCDPKALQPHWTALLPLQAPLQPRPLSPHLVTVLLHDPLIKVRALAAATIASLLEGPAPRAILAVAEAKSMAPRAPLRGFLTLSLSLGQLLLGAHAGLLAAAGGEASTLALPGVLRALVVLMAASPYERLPPELLPEILKVVRARWSALVAPGAVPAAELGPVRAAYLAVLAECFSTKQPIPGLVAHLSQPGGGADAVLGELLGVGRDAGSSAVERIEALGALKGLAAHYTFALPADVWDDLRATAAGGLAPPPPPSPRSSPGQQRGGASGPPSRTSSSSSLNAAGAHGPAAGDWRSGARGPPGRGQASPGQQHGPSNGAAAGSGSNSPEDKAAQLSVKLVSDYLASLARQLGLPVRGEGGEGGGAADGADGPGGGPLASPAVVFLGAALQRQQQVLPSPVSVASDEAREAGVRRLGELWRDAVALLVPGATAHASYMVRAAGLACLGEVPEPAFVLLPAAQQRHLLQLLSAAAASEPVAAVRAAACKALGAVAVFPAVLDDPALAGDVSRVLPPCLRDSVLSVRIAAGWAVANLCDAHRLRLAAAAGGEQQQQQQQLARAESHSQASTSAAAPAAGGAASASGAAQPAPPPLQPHHYRQLAALCSAATTATQDSDKVRANGVRAVGNLLALLTPAMGPGLSGRHSPAAPTPPARGPPGFAHAHASPPHAHASPPPAHAQSQSPHSRLLGDAADGGGVALDGWLDSALTCLQSCLTTGNMKVQWNACYATLGLLRNAPLLAHPRADARVAPMLLLLVMLVRESSNFKIRTHAAAALAALPSRGAYGDVLPDALLVVAAALEGMGGGGRAAAGAAGGEAAGGASKGDPAGAGAGGDDDGGGDGRFPNYRYAAGLSAQLRATLLHLLALAQPGDARRVREALAKRVDFLCGTLREQLEDAVQPLRAAAAASEVLPLGVLGQEEGGWGAGGGSQRGSGSGGPAAQQQQGSQQVSRRSSGLQRELSGGVPAPAAGLGRSSSTGLGGGGGSPVELPSDPFGVGAGKGPSPRGAGGAGQGLAGVLQGLNLRDLAAAPAGAPAGAQVGRPGSGAGNGHSTQGQGVGASAWGAAQGPGAAAAGGGSKRALTVVVEQEALGAGGGMEDAELRRARRRVAALAGALRGLGELLPQLGPACEPALQDVRRVLELLP